MNKFLKKIAFLIGLGILFVSIYWSQDGWNFDVAGDSGYTTEALAIGWFLAISVSVLQFVFSSNLRELNMSLIVIGLIAYVYSIYTNKWGITHFQGAQPNEVWAWALGFLMDATAEPLIAWSLGVSRDGDFLGNIAKTIINFFNSMFESAQGKTPARQFESNSRHQQDTKPRMNTVKNDDRKPVKNIYEPFRNAQNRQKGEKNRSEMGFLQNLIDEEEKEDHKPSRFNL